MGPGRSSRRKSAHAVRAHPVSLRGPRLTTSPEAQSRSADKTGPDRRPAAHTTGAMTTQPTLQAINPGWGRATDRISAQQARSPTPIGHIDYILTNTVEAATGRASRPQILGHSAILAPPGSNLRLARR